MFCDRDHHVGVVYHQHISSKKNKNKKEEKGISNTFLKAARKTGGPGCNLPVVSSKIKRSKRNSSRRLLAFLLHRC